MKFRGNPKKYLPALGFLPTAVLAVCIAVSLGDYTAPVLSLDAVGESAEKSTETSTTEKRRERKTAAVTTKAPAPAVEKLSESGTYKDGTYTGTGTGFSGPITVQVVIEDGKIKDITILSATDDSPYLQNASALLKQIVALQSTNVDTVSGATYSSVGLISAVRDALQKAGGSSASDSALPTLAAAKSQSNEEPPTVETVEEPAAYRDGVYTGTGTGFGGEMTVQVTVSGGRITDIQILSSKDDSPYLQNASALLRRWLPRDLGGLEAAMLLGDKAALPDTVQDTFRAAGISHLLAVSGLHLALLCGLFSFGRRRRFYRPLILVRAAVAVFYMLLTGLPISVLRAGIVFLLVLLGDGSTSPSTCSPSRVRRPFCWACKTLTRPATSAFSFPSAPCWACRHPWRLPVGKKRISPARMPRAGRPNCAAPG